MEEDLVGSQLMEPETKPVRNWIKIALSAGLGLVLTIGLIFVGYQLGQQKSQSILTSIPKSSPSPTPDLTANWKTYTDSLQKISFDYPSSLAVSGKETIRVFLTSSGTKGLIFEVNKYPNTTLKIQFESDRAVFDKTAQLKDVNLNIQGAKEAIYKDVIVESETIPELKITYFQKGVDLYAVSVRNGDSTSNQILSSFKFLD